MFRDLRLCLLVLAGTALACSGGNPGGSNGSSLTITACGLNLPDAGTGIACPAPSVPADGVSIITLNFLATASDGSSPYNGVVDVTSNAAVIFGDGKVGDDLVNVSSGKASQTITCVAGTSCVGQFTLTASLVSNGANATTAVKVTFTGPPVPDAGGTTGGTGTGTGSTTGGTGTGGTGGTGGSTTGSDAGAGGIKFIMETNPYMGIDYRTNYVKFPTDTLTFEVTDTTGNIPIGGVPVNVVIGLSAPSVGYLVGAFDGGAENEAFSAVSLGDGTFTVKTQSGQKAGTVTVTASVSNDGGANISGSKQVSVIGTQPSAARSTVSCSPVNLPVYALGISGLPCETTAAGAPLSTVCTVNLADRFGQVVEVPITVQFFTEAGNFTSASVTTPDFQATGTAGQAQTTLQTTSNLPLDVDPLMSEPSYVDDDVSGPDQQRCGPRTYNPRDGLVTVIAVFSGEETYKDLNATGIYEPGDPFTDLPQPFVDADDNSVYDPGEICPGSAVSGTCGGPNGAWDANSTLFLETRILYSGPPISLPTAVNPQGSTITFFNPGPGELDVGQSATVVGSVNWSDANLNVGAFTNANAVYNVVLASGPQTDALTYPATGSPQQPKDSLGMSVTSITACDAGSVASDGGNVPAAICRLQTQVSQFSGGFTSQYKLSNSNTQTGKGGSLSVTANESLLGGDPASNSLLGQSE